jgi:membrane protease subunit (stomatin/prohibitin family)
MGLGAGMSMAQQMMNATNFGGGQQPPAAPPASPAPGGAPAAPAGAAGAATKFCMNCGHSIPRAAKFCSECGGAQQ